MIHSGNRVNARWLVTVFLCLYHLLTGYGQVVNPGSAPRNAISNITKPNYDLFGTAKCFIKNIGQYGDTATGNGDMGKILFGYEGLGMPVLFTRKGLIHLQRKVEGPTEEEREREEKETRDKHLKEEPEEQRAIDKVITMEWLNANQDVAVTEEEQSSAYHTYPSVKGKAFGYKKIIYKNLYPGIDVIYSLSATSKAGFEYSLLVLPGADLNKVAVRFGGDVKKIFTDNRGNLVIKSGIEGIIETIPVTYYGEEVFNKSVGDVKTNYSISGNEIHFLFPRDYDHSKAIVIDPFVSSTSNLTGLNAGKAKDVDFDYAGNIYVTGGGNSTIHQLAKFDATGALQWTFSGSLTNPSWTFGSYWGGWMVEKPTGNVYLGQGFNPTTGFQVIQISTTGLYNNYITTANPNFREAWKMIWSCNNGSPQILVAGGGTNSNINFGVFVPPSTTISSLNVTGIPYTGSAGWAQDIVDFIIDPSNNDMYTIYGSLIGNPSLTNKMYKNTAPYSGASVAWTVPSGFTSVQEIANRPYLIGGEIDNSANIFAINASYLYYWDGKNLKAFDKATGNGVGTPLITANTTLMQGGIIADACDNVFVGDASGVIKVYKFNGSVFNDVAAPDIAIPGFSGKAIYDLAYDDAKKLLYVSGDGFIGSFDISSYCASTQYTLNVVPNCANASANITVSPAPPAGSSVTYVLSAGGNQLATNTTGVFTGLSPNVSYTVVATINLACSGARATTTFVLPGPAVNTAQLNTNCGSATGSLTATGSGTTAPYSYSINGVTFQASGLFTGLTAGVYTLTVKDANGCVNTKVITILNSNGPTLTYTSTNADCGNNNGTITASVTGGTAPYTYSINGTVFQSGNFFTGLVGGTYTLTVKDATGCTNAAVVTINSSPSPLITAIPAASTCGSSNGSITAFGSGGTGALQYSINGNIFQPGNVFTNLTPGSYSVTVRDANGCTKSTLVTIANSPSPTVTTTTTPASCNNINGTITATGSGGIAPLQYSINGITFQSSNIFTGLATGSYTITVKDATGCTNFISVNVGSTGGPIATALSSVSACSSNTGTITASANGGVPPYQYSINGSTFQAGKIFSGLAAGNYVVYVRDASGCIGTVSIVVGNTAGPTLTAITTVTACNANTGTIVATANGGTLPYQYSLNGITYQAANSFTALATGNYTVYVKDNNGCIKTTDVNVVNVAGLALDVSTITSACSGNSGTITATATGGVTPLQYSVNGTTYQASNAFNGLTPGIYNVSVKDANGCIVTSPATVASVAGPTLSINSTDATCGGANGIIDATGSGGLPPFTYSLNGITFQSSGTFLNVAAGSYNFILKDAAGCTASQTVVINNIGTGPGITTFTVRTSGAYPCNGDLGSITNPRVNGSNCNNCTFSLNSGPFVPNRTQLFLNLNAGTYTVTAMDANGCTSTILATVNLAPLSTATSTVTGTACNTTNGTITITGVGPNTPYHASISGIGGPWITFNATYTFTGLAPGTYTIILADDESFDSGPPIDPGGCLDTIQVIVPSIGGPSLSLAQTNVSCGSNTGSITATGSAGTAPYTYSLDGINYFTSGIFSNLAPGNYVVSVQDATGCINIAQVTLTSSSPPSLIADIQSSSCSSNNGMVTATGNGGIAPLQYSINGTAFQNSNVFTNLVPGNYTLYVKDSGGCYGTLPVTIVNTPLPKVTAFTIAATCSNNDGSIVATGSQGSLPYVFSINGTVYQSSNTFSNLAAGFYTVYIKDAGGCVTTSGVSVGNVGSPTFTSTTTSTTCGNANGSITIAATGGSGSYQYSKDGITFQASNIFSGLSPGTYTIFVKAVNGCLVSKTILVTNTNGPQTLTATIINTACGGSNGSITATASGGTSPLQYSLNGTTYQASNAFTNIAAAAYTLYVKDANGCIKTLPVQILNLPPPSLTATSSPSSCGSNDGTITAIATGGTLPLTYSKNGITFQSSNIFLSLAGGSYTITVKDAKACTATFDISVSIAGTSTTPTFNPIAAICSGATLSPLPTTSTNSITGTWSPVLNNTTTTTYTFTPGTGQCASTVTMTITVNSLITPTFNAVAPICAGATLSPLPTTSTNGITGTWSPALNNTATTTYTFTPGTGQCASTTTMTITVNPLITPTFNAVAAICSGATLSPLPTTSINGITGTWLPALNNTATTTYTFTPGTGQCASTATMTITVNPVITPTFISVAAICSGATLSPLPTTSTNGVTGTWSPALNNTATKTYTFTPATGQCASTTTMTITVTPLTTPAFNPIAAICSGATLSPLPTISTNGITGTWSPALNNTATTTYTFTPATGQCASITTMTIIVNPATIPTFNAVAAICAGATLSPLPTTSTNGITGTWSPAINNTATTTYTFTPAAGQCASTTTMTITVNPLTTPTFNPIAAICSGATLSPLPTTSTNGITGTWLPALNNTATTTYTFTPGAGQCASTATMTITVNPVITPTFSPVAAICSGATLSPLPTTSTNGITGTWLPALNNTATTTYTFTPGIGQCASTTTMTITVNPLATPAFNPIAAICSGATLLPLPTTSINGITGTWSPALNNTATTTYTFTPATGQCASTATITITVNPLITPTFNPVASICSGATLSPLPTISTNGITGTWLPALNNTATTTYTFTPAAGQCASTTTMTITVNPAITPTFNAVAAICSGATLLPLPTISINGITGTWSPALNNTATTTYTFTPGTGQCSSTTTMTIIVNPAITPTFNSVAAVCAGATLSPLPTTSTNGITGTWSPALNNTATTTYTFTPATGQCASITTMTIIVNPAITPIFNVVAAICSGGALTPLPTTSTNGITGTWSPALNNTATTTYTFTPVTGQCASITTMTIIVNPAITPTFNVVAAICSGGALTPLPTTSTNGITGTWSPALNNTATTTYTFTPVTGQCASITTMTIIVNPAITPTFNVVAAICSGGALTPLPTTSTNGITGTWSPALNNTATTTYTFTPAAGQCASTTTMTITVNPLTTPTFNAIAPICSGATLPPLPTTSTNGITGTWLPALNNSATTTYTFTPGIGQCASIATMTITVNPIIAATLNCGVSTSSSVIFTWAAVSGATGYNVSYQVNSTPVVNVGPVGNVLSYQVAGLTGGDNVSITVMPTGSAGSCFASATKTCTATACTPPTASISYATPYCGSLTGSQAVTLTGTGAFTAGVFSAPVSLTLNPATGAITPNSSIPGTYTVSYNIAASGGCPGVTATTTVTIAGVITPTFNAVAPICSGSILSPLPTTSTNGITGTWSPALNNTATMTYTFTPGTGQCASTAKMTITVTLVTIPTFNPVAAICSGVALSPLPTTSTNGITGTWSPALNNIATTTYTFTPGAGQCASTTTMTITVNPSTVPTFNVLAPICPGATLSPLPTVSTNGITGTWFPALNNRATTTYTFTPGTGQCASTTTITIIVSAAPTAPLTNVIQPTCTLPSGTILITSATTGLTFSLDGGAFNVYPITGYLVSPGSHTLQAQNGQGCTSLVTSVLINPVPAPPSAIVINITDAACATNNGGFTLGAVAGGVAPYLYSVNGSSFTTTQTYASLFAGVFSLDVMDANGCILTSPVTIKSVNGATVAATATNASCGASNGSVRATASGGTMPYQYSINGTTFQASNVFSNLAANSYTVTIKDANNCINSVTVVVGNSGGATVSAIITNTSCGLGNGTITVTGAGGTVPYQYSINGTTFQASNAFSNLAANAYIVTIKDANGCTNTTTVSINSSTGASVSAAATNASCGVGDGSISAKGSGGTLPYQYSINGTTFQASGIFLNLVANTYIVSIRDANNCINTTPVVVGSNNSVSVNAGPDITICEGTSGQIIATSNSQNILWSPAIGLNDPAIINPIASPGVTTKYVLTATQGPCSTSDTVIVFVNPAPVANAGNDVSICFGKTTQLSGSGGLTYQWSPPAFLSNTAISNPVLISPPEGTLLYFLSVIGNNGCRSLAQDTVAVTILPQPQIFAGADTSITVNQPLQLQATDINNAGFIQYLWSPSAGLNNATIQNPVATLSSGIRYVLTATTAAGCQATDDIKITVFLKPELFVPSAFTPNNDGINDVLKVIPVGIKELKYFKIFNRWGEMIFNTTDASKGWDGNYKGQGQNTYVFIWMAEAIDYNGNMIHRKGTVTLIR